MFDEMFDRLIGHEGGYVNNPADPGGETNWLDFMTRLSNWPDASRGWVRRIANNLRYGAEDS
jgi:lysozyme family protein